MNKHDRSHLRVVDDAAGTTQSEEQLALPFEQDSFIIALVNVTNAPEQKFLDLLTDVSPEVIVDLRVVP